MLVQDGGSHRAIKVRNEKEITSYFLRSYLLNSIAGGGFEPPTSGLWARRATRLLYPAANNSLIRVANIAQKSSYIKNDKRNFTNSAEFSRQ